MFDFRLAAEFRRISDHRLAALLYFIVGGTPAGVAGALAPVEPRVLLLEQYFLPLEHSAAEAVVREINREIGLRSMLESTDYGASLRSRRWPPAARRGTAYSRRSTIASGGWRAEAEGKDASFMPHPDELRRRLGIPPGR
jgi:hypothetical protein